jgi:hypothetical protein
MLQSLLKYGIKKKQSAKQVEPIGGDIKDLWPAREEGMIQTSLKRGRCCGLRTLVTTAIKQWETIRTKAMFIYNRFL